MTLEKFEHHTKARIRALRWERLIFQLDSNILKMCFSDILRNSMYLSNLGGTLMLKFLNMQDT